MKLHQIALAVAIVAAGSAHAATPPGAPLTGALATAVNNAASKAVFISGASAVKKGFTGIVASMFAGTPTYYAESTSSDYLAVVGKLAVAAGGWPAGSDAMIVYRTGGGSVYGVNPVARNEAITSLKVTAASCSSTVGAGTFASPYICDLGTAIPDAGVSDVAPFLFKGPVNTEGEVPADSLNDAELADLAATPIYGLAFGIPVTNTVPAGIKFTRSTVAAIMSGNVGTWDQVDSSLAATDDITICRRTPGSGTQAVMNLWAGNFPCSADANPPADRDSSSAWDASTRTFTVDGGAGLTVVENFASGDVAKCLDAAQTAAVAAPSGYTTYATKDRDGAPVTVKFKNGVSHKAIGVLSMDSLAKSTTTSKWKFRALDGAGDITWTGVAATAPVATLSSGTGKLPTFATFENGDWDLQGWASFNLPSRTTGDKLALLNEFLTKAQDPAILDSIPDLKYVAAAIPGGAYTGPKVLDAAYLNGNQCAPYNRNNND
jgi:hypothetical protein